MFLKLKKVAKNNGKIEILRQNLKINK